MGGVLHSKLSPQHRELSPRKLGKEKKGLPERDSNHFVLTTSYLYKCIKNPHPRHYLFTYIYIYIYLLCILIHYYFTFYITIGFWMTWILKKENPKTESFPSSADLALDNLRIHIYVYIKYVCVCLLYIHIWYMCSLYICILRIYIYIHTRVCILSSKC